MSNLHTLYAGQHIVYCIEPLAKQISAEWFDASFWQQQNKLSGSATGRGITYFIEHQQQAMVLRHYRRGGLIGRLVQDQYLYIGEKQTRAWQELQLLNQLEALNLPASRPVGARVLRKGLYYCADLLTERIPQAQDMHNILCRQAVDKDTWRNIGATIARFHQHQVFHHDLNIHNIMLDAHQNVWLIDFDKCAIRNDHNWKQANLQRLQRSLNKELAKQPRYFFDTNCFSALIEGYNSVH